MEKQQNIKTTICTFWEKDKCKFNDNPQKCSYAHGESDLRENVCKYGNECFNDKCIFLHNFIIPKIEVNLIDCIKNKKSKKIRKIVYNDLYKEKEDTIRNCEIMTITKCDKNKDKTILFYENKIKDIIQEYIKKEKILEEKINHLNNIIKEKDDNLGNLYSDSNKLNKIYCIDNNSIIKKYYNIGKLLNIQNNKIDTIYIKQYFNCKNIYMIKNRCNRIYKLISYMKEHNINYIKSSLRNIFHMNNDMFLNNLKYNLFFK